LRLATRVFLVNALIIVVCFSYPVYWARSTLRLHYLQTMEDALVDQAHILAALVGSAMKNGQLDRGRFQEAFEGLRRRSISARIYRFNKRSVDMQVYVTDRSGRVIFDSENGLRVGLDYSAWQDVSLTLQGKYGARTTRKDPSDPSSTTLYVAAPVMVRGEIAGVLTLVKPTTSINKFLGRAKRDVARVFGVSAAIAVLLMLLASYRMTAPIRRLTRYANGVREGTRVSLPKLDESEIGEMGLAFEEMRVALEGRRYVEEYVHSLTHEIKGPLSAIRGAAELLTEKMEPEQQDRFLTNIRGEAARIQDIIDRMLQLSVLENLKDVEKKEGIVFRAMLGLVLEGKHALITRKNVSVVAEDMEDVIIEGDSFLLRQALDNLIQNAIDFSAEGGQIELTGQTDGTVFRFSVRDFGPGIPDYARTKVFDRFFSLQRPDTGKKSTGLGLNLVREVALLHGGAVVIDNCPGGGARAELTLPTPGPARMRS
jgi:two-component system, OmpR family, sensor histidine kinase CreC